MQGTIGGVRRKTIYFTAPRQVELREESLPAPGADQVLVETVCSAISAGTEMLVYRGQFPHFKDVEDTFSSELNIPVRLDMRVLGGSGKLGNKWTRNCGTDSSSHFNRTLQRSLHNPHL